MLKIIILKPGIFLIAPLNYLMKTSFNFLSRKGFKAMILVSEKLGLASQISYKGANMIVKTTT